MPADYEATKTDLAISDHLIGRVWLLSSTKAIRVTPFESWRQTCLADSTET